MKSSGTFSLLIKMLEICQNLDNWLSGLSLSYLDYVSTILQQPLYHQLQLLASAFQIRILPLNSVHWCAKGFTKYRAIKWTLRRFALNCLLPLLFRRYHCNFVWLGSCFGYCGNICVSVYIPWVLLESNYWCTV